MPSVPEINIITMKTPTVLCVRAILHPFEASPKPQAVKTCTRALTQKSCVSHLSVSLAVALLALATTLWPVIWGLGFFGGFWV